MGNDERKLIPGVIIEMGGTDYTVPPLNFAAVKKVAAKLPSLKDMKGGLPDNEQIDTMVEIIHLAMKRNYPEITADELIELLDMGNVMRVIEAIMSGSGFTQQGE